MIGTLIAVILVLAVFGVSSVSAQSLINGDFETGDFTGWTKYVPSGGAANVVTSHTGSQGTSYSPVNGGYFARLKTDGASSYTTLTQDVYMSEGATIAGWAAFDCRDSTYWDDDAYVEIDGTTLWSKGCADGSYKDHPWASWSWTAPASGTYTLELGIANYGDNAVDSYALFDYVVLTDTAIPEFSTIALPVASILGLLFFFNHRKRRKEE